MKVEIMDVNIDKGKKKLKKNIMKDLIKRYGIEKRIEYKEKY